MKPNRISLKEQEARYTKGKEYILGLDEYVGEYHLRGRVPWTEPEPSLTSRKLEPYTPFLEVRRYNIIRPDEKKITTYLEPYHMIPIPTKSNYDVGNITRYFVRDRFVDYALIIEIDSDQVSRYGKANGIDDVKYQLESLFWYISKNEKTINRISLLNSSNLISLNRKMPGIVDFVPNLFEFSELSV